MASVPGQYFTNGHIVGIHNQTGHQQPIQNPHQIKNRPFVDCNFVNRGSNHNLNNSFQGLNDTESEIHYLNQQRNTVRNSLI